MSEDGLCGIPEPGGAVACRLDFGHPGPHSWAGRSSRVRIFGGITAEEVRERAAAGSPAARAIAESAPPGSSIRRKRT